MTEDKHLRLFGQYVLWYCSVKVARDNTKNKITWFCSKKSLLVKNKAGCGPQFTYLCFLVFGFFFAGARTNDHQLPKYQKRMLLKSRDVNSTHRAIKLLYTCHSPQKPFFNLPLILSICLSNMQLSWKRITKRELE